MQVLILQKQQHYYQYNQKARERENVGEDTIIISMYT